MLTLQAVVAEPAPVLWYANRGSGFVLLVLLTTTTAAGVLATAAPGSAGWPRAATQSLHRNIGLLSAVFLVVHVATSVLDAFVDIRWWHAFVPFAASYERAWLGLGVVALDLMIAIVLTSLLRGRMNHRAWRVVHFAAYVVWALGLLHGLMLGTDAGTRWGLALTAGCTLLVAAAVGMRVTSTGARPPVAGAPKDRPVDATARVAR